MSTTTRMGVKNVLRRAGSDGDARSNQNTILLKLPGKEFSTLLPALKLVQLPTHTFAYFIESGLASVLNVLEDGKSVEVGLAGKEGFIGIPLVVGFSSSPNRVIMQVEGSGFKISAAAFAAILPQCPQLEKSLQRFSQELGVQAMQVAACNRLHEVDERLARWLLMSQDRLGGDIVPLTQEFLAHMLGTRRASVTLAAGMLQKAGLIAYSRGEVKIENRKELEDASCECYAAINRQSQNWRDEAKN
jgi:CRP-like cAMP-binding protein